jgi:superfamily II DNA or RNA helicase
MAKDGDSIRDALRAFTRQRAAREQKADPSPTSSSERGIADDIQTQAKHPASFQKGQMVALTVDPKTTGTILEILAPVGGTPRYRVFHGANDVREYAADQLVSLEVTPRDRPRFLPLPDFRIALTAYRIRNPDSENVYAFRAARIQHIPFQYKPLIRITRSDRPRLLIADEVGVGKTIEAGLIMRELEARHGLQNVLVVCPKALVTKWRSEMRRFDQDFAVLSSSDLRGAIREAHLEGVWHPRYSRAIVSLEALRRDEVLRGAPQDNRPGLLGLNPPPRFDLVIIDEAHHLRNPASNSHQVAEFLSEASDGMVLLSATPIQLGSHDLFFLLRLLEPDVFQDFDLFSDMIEPNTHLNAAVGQARTQNPTPGWEAAAAQELEAAAETSWGRRVLANDPRLIGWIGRLAQERNLQRRDRVRLIRDVEDLHTLAHVINRTRRRDIGQFTIRDPHTAAVPFTAAQNEFYGELVSFRQHVLGLKYPPNVVRLISDTLERQASSCLPALGAAIEAIIRRNAMILDEWTDASEEEDGQWGLPPDILQRAQHLRELAENLPEEDPKLDRLVQMVNATLGQEGPRKVLIFSYFLHTLDYLRSHLVAPGCRVAVVNGKVPDEERQRLRDRFRLPSSSPQAIDVLLSSEVGCEGLDYEFCDTLVNYDIPWNPMRLEQRIGRIDRFGQASPKVNVVNFVTPGTVEERIYFRCFERIGIFRRSLGDLEAILGDVVEQLGSLTLTKSLSPAQERERAEQIADNALRRLEEDERLEEASTDIVTLDTLIETEVDDAAESGRFIPPRDLRFLVEEYIRMHDARAKLQRTADNGGVLKLVCTPDAAATMSRNILAASKGSSFQGARLWLESSERLCTFEQEVAVERRDVQFITPLHPLCKAAAAEIDKVHSPGLLLTALKVDRPDLPTGRFLLSLEEWNVRAMRPETRFNVQAWNLETNEEEHLFAEAFWHCLAEGSQGQDEALDSPRIGTAKGELEELHEKARRRALDELGEENRAMVNRRKAGLELYYDRQIARVGKESEDAAEPKIRTMKEAQLARLNQRRDEILGQMKDFERTDILAKSVAVVLLSNKRQARNEGVTQIE